METINETLSKLLVKLYYEDTKSSKWVHLSYVPFKLYDNYKEKNPEDAKDWNGTLARWCKEDFDKDIKVYTENDLNELKTLVKNFYKESYPDVYLEQSTDRQGWLRVWISKKMKEDLEKNGE